MITIHSVETIRTLLANNDIAVDRAMVALFRRQTEAEKQTGSTLHLNCQGFSAAHAKKGTYYAKWVLSGRRLTGRFLEHARTMAMHYAGQLVNIASQRVSNPEVTGSLPQVENASQGNVAQL